MNSYALGLGDPIEVSAVHGHGTGDLLDACVESFPPDDGEEYDEDVIKVAIIGKPNVGKSSLLNQILGEERVIVSNVAGTTRDAIDSYFENESGKFLFIDTAGMRRKSKVDDAVEKYSNLRSIAAIERADVCLILIDANEGVTEQDTKVAGLAHEAGKACIIVVNKWDTVEKDTNTMDEKTAEIRRDLSYMTYAPVVFISALTGQRVDKLFDMIVAVSNQNSMRITTGMLNNILEDATARVQPPTDKGRRLKIYYITQVGVKPPHFVFFCNDSRLFHFSYQRYLENQIRAVFGLTGTPIKITIRQKGDKGRRCKLRSRQKPQLCRDFWNFNSKRGIGNNGTALCAICSRKKPSSCLQSTARRALRTKRPNGCWRLLHRSALTHGKRPRAAF